MEACAPALIACCCAWVPDAEPEVADAGLDADADAGGFGRTEVRIKVTTSGSPRNQSTESLTERFSLDGQGGGARTGMEQRERGERNQRDVDRFLEEQVGARVCQ